MSTGSERKTVTALAGAGIVGTGFDVHAQGADFLVALFGRLAAAKRASAIRARKRLNRRVIALILHTTKPQHANKVKNYGQTIQQS